MNNRDFVKLQTRYDNREPEEYHDDDDIDIADYYDYEPSNAELDRDEYWRQWKE